eukprot:Awhi_evm1s150
MISSLMKTSQLSDPNMYKSNHEEDKAEALEAYKKADAVRMTSTTGKSAILVNGRTIHSLIYALKSSPKKFRNITMIVVDEMSMMGKTLPCDLDAELQDVKQNKEPFGLCSIVFGW